MTTKLKRAAAHIDAVELPDGRYAHYANETSTWWIIPADALEELCDYLNHEDPQISGDAYSHWCAGTARIEQPSGWTPDHPVVVCECGQWSGERCCWSGEESEAVLVETMPVQLRAQHDAARNRGRFPSNGGLRLRVSPGCADLMLETDGEWCSIVEAT